MFGKFIAARFDVNSKTWYILASVKLDMAIALEVCVCAFCVIHGYKGTLSLSFFLLCVSSFLSLLYITRHSGAREARYGPSLWRCAATRAHFCCLLLALLLLSRPWG